MPDSKSPQSFSLKSSRGGQFCPKCGKTQGEFIGMFCKECFLKDHPALVHMPDKLELEFCQRCQKVRIEGQWVIQDEMVLKKWIEKKINVRKLHDVVVEIQLIPQTDATSDIETHIMGGLEGEMVEFNLKSKLMPRKSICNDDMLVSSNYYEGIIQVRFEEKTPEKVRQVQTDIEEALKPLNKNDSKAVVTTWEIQKFGFDAWIVSRKATKAAAVFVSRKYHGTIKVSPKLIGLSEKGKHESRMTYLVRIP
jgi:NMD protein affecting ribosome stability and mRNA decay